MVNVKAFAILVFLTIGIVIAALASLSGSNQKVQASAAAPARLPSVVDDEGGASALSEIQSSENHLPLMVRWSNWRPEFGPAYVYAREADLSGMLALSAPVEKMLMVASYAEVQRLVGQADQLKAAGVTTLGFNSENGTGMTPPDEMQTLNSSDPNVNVVARSAAIGNRAMGLRFYGDPCATRLTA